MKDNNSEVYLVKLENVQPVRNGYLIVKRVFDLVFAILFAIPASIVILIFGVLIKMDTPGPMFYKQERVGKMGSVIYVIKLRSMYTDAESKSGAVWAKKNDSRITKMGHFVRMTRIDELPQIFSVISGEMSFIGPRPERPSFTSQFSEEFPGFEKRLRVTPGLSGLAQIRGGYDATPSEKLADDLEYIDNISFKVDLLIVLHTLSVLVTGHGAH